MNEDSFFEVLETQYAKKLPFAVYSRPINSVIKCWLQEDDTIYKTTEFSESGFVFAPFDLNQQTIVLPEERCQQFVLETKDLKVEGLSSYKPEVDTKQRAQHIDLVIGGIEAIKKEDLEKVVLSRYEELDIEETNPLTIFKRLFNRYKNAMVYCWYHPKVGLWLGATPELLFKVEGKQLTTISLAGTQPYRRISKVTWTNKELEEQQIVTDFLAERIAPYTSSTNISEVETIRAGSLLHLKTRLVSRINQSSNLQSIIEALHPTPAVCGFPKGKAKDFILQNENYNREYYTGFLGELNLKQIKSRNLNRKNVENNAYASIKTQSNFYVNLRCMQIKNGKAIIYVGGGITKDSVAENEWQETVNKTKTIGSILN